MAAFPSIFVAAFSGRLVSLGDGVVHYKHVGLAEMAASGAAGTRGSLSFALLSGVVLALKQLTSRKGTCCCRPLLVQSDQIGGTRT